MIGIALGSAAFGDYDLPTALSLTAAAGFTALDLQLDSTLVTTQSVDLTSDGGLAQMRRSVEDAGLTVACVSNVRDVELLLGPHGRHSDGVLRGGANQKIAHARRAALRTVDAAVALGTPYVRLFFGCPDHLLAFPWHGFDESWSENLRILVAQAAEILEYAARRDVLICVEPHPRQAIFDRPSLDEARALLATRGHNIGLCLDPANLVAGGLDALNYIISLACPPEFVHFKDVEVWSAATTPRGPGWRRYGPGRPVRFRAVGDGDLRWPRIRDALVDLDFDGTVVVEHEDLLTSRMPSLRHALAAAQRLFASDATAVAQWW